MSYTIHLEVKPCEHCGRSDVDFEPSQDVSYNYYNELTEALGFSPMLLDKVPCVVAEIHLQQAYLWLSARVGGLNQNYTHARDIIFTVLEWTLKEPEGRLHIIP